MEKFGIQMLKRTKPILSDLGTYLSKVNYFQILVPFYKKKRGPMMPIKESKVAKL